MPYRIEDAGNLFGCVMVVFTEKIDNYEIEIREPFNVFYPFFYWRINRLRKRVSKRLAMVLNAINRSTGTHYVVSESQSGQ